MTLNQAIEQFLDRPKFSALTRQGYRDSLRRFFNAAKVSTIAQATTLEREDFVRLIRELEKTFKPATINHTVAAVRQFYKSLRDEDRSIENPTEDYKVKQPDNVPDWNVLHSGDPAPLLDKITNLRDRAVFLTLVLQGWRVSPLCSMRWSKIRKERDGVLVAEFKDKRNKLRTQALQGAVVDAARAWAKSIKAPMEGNAPFIVAEAGSLGPLTRHKVYAIVTKYSSLFGRRVTPHGLRATYISSVISRKGIEAARQLAGHTSISTTQRYSRWQINRDDPLTVEDL